MSSLGTFDQKYFNCVFLGNNLKKTIAISEISTLKFVYLENFPKNKSA